MREMARRNFTLDSETEERIAALLPHHEHNASMVVREAIKRMWQSEIGFFQREPPHITGYVAYRPAAPLACADCGKVISEGWQAVMSDGSQGAVFCGPCVEN
jgi:hypothetical protein